MFELGPKRRLKKSQEISTVLRGSARFSDEAFSIYKRPNQLNCARLGIRIAKKQVRFAHERQRIKRQIKEFFRINISGSTDYLVRVKKQAGCYNNQQIRQSLARLF